MDYPFWDTTFGYGMLMATISILHVFISHFAIGGGLYLVVTETIARKKNDLQTLAYLEQLSKFFVLVSVVLGALTGVAIWFIIGLINPTATEALIHNYLWAWATEWTFFIIEIAAAILYYYGWKRMSAKNHLALGWAYFAAAWLSLFVVNGILSYMLTPGEWLTTGNVWDGFFNPTFWSSTFYRTGICILLAGLYAMLVASRYKADDFKKRLIRQTAYWGLAGLVIVIPAFFWYWDTIPAEMIANAQETMPTTMRTIWESYLYLGLLAFVLVLFGLILPKRVNVLIAVVLMASGLGYFGSFEFFRESIRKPYVITDYIYGNALEVAKTGTYEDEGYISQIKFQTDDPGADLFRHICRSCHTLDGYKPLLPAFNGTEEQFIASMVNGVGAMKGNMPPFMGTDDEVALIAAHIYKKIDRRSISEIYGVTGIELGRKVYDIRCGQCHEMGGYNDKQESLVGLEESDYHYMLDLAEDYADEMPAFTGDDTEREALILYLMSLGNEEGGNR